MEFCVEPVWVEYAASEGLSGVLMGACMAFLCGGC